LCSGFRAWRTQEKNQESGGGDMQRKLNWFDLICIGIGEAKHLRSKAYSDVRVFHGSVRAELRKELNDEAPAFTGVILGSGIFSSTPFVAAHLAGCAKPYGTHSTLQLSKDAFLSARHSNLASNELE